MVKLLYLERIFTETNKQLERIFTESHYVAFGLGRSLLPQRLPSFCVVLTTL